MATNQCQFLLLVKLCCLLSIFNYQHLIKTHKKGRYKHHATHRKNMTSINNYVYSYFEIFVSYPLVTYAKTIQTNYVVETLLSCSKLFMKAFQISKNTIGPNMHRNFFNFKKPYVDINLNFFNHKFL